MQNRRFGIVCFSQFHLTVVEVGVGPYARTVHSEAHQPEAAKPTSHLPGARGVWDRPRPQAVVAWCHATQFRGWSTAQSAHTAHNRQDERVTG